MTEIKQMSDERHGKPKPTVPMSGKWSTTDAKKKYLVYGVRLDQLYGQLDTAVYGCPAGKTKGRVGMAVVPRCVWEHYKGTMQNSNAGSSYARLIGTGHHAAKCNFNSDASTFRDVRKDGSKVFYKKNLTGYNATLLEKMNSPLEIHYYGCDAPYSDWLDNAPITMLQCFKAPPQVPLPIWKNLTFLDYQATSANAYVDYEKNRKWPIRKIKECDSFPGVNAVCNGGNTFMDMWGPSGCWQTGVQCAAEPDSTCEVTGKKVSITNQYCRADQTKTDISNAGVFFSVWGPLIRGSGGQGAGEFFTTLKQPTKLHSIRFTQYGMYRYGRPYAYYANQFWGPRCRGSIYVAVTNSAKCCNSSQTETSCECNQSDFFTQAEAVLQKNNQAGNRRGLRQNYAVPDLGPRNTWKTSKWELCNTIWGWPQLTTTIKCTNAEAKVTHVAFIGNCFTTFAATGDVNVLGGMTGVHVEVFPSDAEKEEDVHTGTGQEDEHRGTGQDDAVCKDCEHCQHEQAAGRQAGSSSPRLGEQLGGNRKLLGALTSAGKGGALSPANSGICIGMGKSGFGADWKQAKHNRGPNYRLATHIEPIESGNMKPGVANARECAAAAWSFNHTSRHISSLGRCLTLYMKLCNKACARGVIANSYIGLESCNAAPRIFKQKGLWMAVKTWDYSSGDSDEARAGQIRLNNLDIQSALKSSSEDVTLDFNNTVNYVNEDTNGGVCLTANKIQPPGEGTDDRNLYDRWYSRSLAESSTFENLVKNDMWNCRTYPSTEVPNPEPGIVPNAVGQVGDTVDINALPRACLTVASCNTGREYSN